MGDLGLGVRVCGRYGVGFGDDGWIGRGGGGSGVRTFLNWWFAGIESEMALDSCWKGGTIRLR